MENILNILIVDGDLNPAVSFGAEEFDIQSTQFKRVLRNL